MVCHKDTFPHIKKLAREKRDKTAGFRVIPLFLVVFKLPALSGLFLLLGNKKPLLREGAFLLP